MAGYDASNEPPDRARDAYGRSWHARCRRCRPGPGWETAQTLRQRFREDRLGLTASSLTFTTLIALVPLVTVALAVFSAFPMFEQFQDALERYFLQSLVPEGISRPVLQALTEFAGQASSVGSVGLLLLVLTALALMATIDRTLERDLARARDALLLAARADLLVGRDAGAAAARRRPERHLAGDHRVARRAAAASRAASACSSTRSASPCSPAR